MCSIIDDAPTLVLVLFLSYHIDANLKKIHSKSLFPPGLLLEQIIVAHIFLRALLR